VGKFKQRITETLDTADLQLFRKLVDEYQHEYGVPVIEIAAALGILAQGKKPLQDLTKSAVKNRERDKRSETAPTSGKSGRSRDKAKPASGRKPQREAPEKQKRKTPGEKDKLDIGMERFRLEVGETHGVKPGNIVGAIANEAEIESEYIGRVEIFDDYSIIDLPEGMPKELFKHLKSVWVSGQRLQISKFEAGSKPTGNKKVRKPAKDKTADSSTAKKPLTKAKAKAKTKKGKGSSPVTGARRGPAK
jgi:ATP-dependent RNA helicase DeaD